MHRSQTTQLIIQLALVFTISPYWFSLEDVQRMSSDIECNNTLPICDRYSSLQGFFFLNVMAVIVLLFIIISNEECVHNNETHFVPHGYLSIWARKRLL